MADLTSLIKSLAEMTGLSEEMARDVTGDGDGVRQNPAAR